ncbi:extracellular solute-binding protein [Streptococcus ovis]|uniref:extracellular solute-binding protein n=1 Tax=Streptococcus ovis TaxID=82806 RepID=UPI0003801EA5|nr:extracellular solute-binding protein [Streptococcus ovis]
MKFKTFLKCASVCAFASFLVACGNGQSSDTVQIEFFSQKPEMKATLEEIVKDFEKENPEIDVKFTSVPDPGTVLKTRMANEEAPDIINIYPQNADFKEYAADGRFVELTDDAGLSNLKAGAADTYAVDGKVYSLPLNANAYGIYYNKTAFEKMGLKVPTTYADFKELVAAIKKDGSVAPFALSLGDAWSLNGYHQLAWITVAGGFDGAQDKLIRSGKGAISATDPATTAVLERLALLTDNGQKGFTGAKYADAVAAFAKGEALMMPQGTWAATVVNQQKPDFEYGMFAFPTEDGKTYTVGAADMALSISKESKHQKEAQKFLSYISSKEVFQKYYDVDGSPTAVEGVETEGKFQEIAGVTELAFTEFHPVWLQSEWESEDEFWNVTVETVKKPDAAELAKDLNAFFDPMKK